MCFRLHLSGFNASAEGASDKFGFFTRQLRNDVIVFKFYGRGHSPAPVPCWRPCVLLFFFALWLANFDSRKIHILNSHQLDVTMKFSRTSTFISYMFTFDTLSKACNAEESLKYIFLLIRLNIMYFMRASNVTVRNFWIIDRFLILCSSHVCQMSAECAGENLGIFATNFTWYGIMSCTTKLLARIGTDVS